MQKLLIDFGRDGVASVGTSFDGSSATVLDPRTNGAAAAVRAGVVDEGVATIGWLLGGLGRPAGLTTPARFRRYDHLKLVEDSGKSPRRPPTIDQFPRSGQAEGCHGSQIRTYRPGKANHRPLNVPPGIRWCRSRESWSPPGSIKGKAVTLRPDRDHVALDQHQPGVQNPAKRTNTPSSQGSRATGRPRPLPRRRPRP